MGDRSFPFLIKLLTHSPLNLPLSQARKLAPSLRDFWATIADGDAVLDYPQFPLEVRRYIETYNASAQPHPDMGNSGMTLIDNNSTLLLR
jgi:hypothetical protein